MSDDGLLIKLKLVTQKNFKSIGLSVVLIINRMLQVSATQQYEELLCLPINTLRTGDADLRFYITTVQDG